MDGTPAVPRGAQSSRARSVPESASLALQPPNVRRGVRERRATETRVFPVPTFPKMAFYFFVPFLKQTANDANVRPRASDRGRPLAPLTPSSFSRSPLFLVASCATREPYYDIPNESRSKGFRAVRRDSAARLSGARRKSRRRRTRRAAETAARRFFPTHQVRPRGVRRPRRVSAGASRGVGARQEPRRRGGGGDQARR